MNTERCPNHEFLLEQLRSYLGWKNLTQKLSRGHTIYRDMRESALRGTVSWQTKRQSKCTNPLLHAWTTFTTKRKNWKTVGDVSKVCSQIVLKCLYFARLGRPDILWSVNKFARALSKWTRACDKRLVRLISHIHHASDHRHYCHAGNTAQHCRLGPFQDSDFSGDPEESYLLRVAFCVSSEVEHSFL